MAGREQGEPSARRLEFRRKEIIAEFARQLERHHRTIAQQEDARLAVLALAMDALNEMISAVRNSGDIEGAKPATHRGMPSSDSGSEAAPTYPVDIAHALAGFFGIAATAATECMTDDPDRLASGIHALHQAVSRQIADVTTSGRESPAENLCEARRAARREERQRLARALHDRLGADINIAHRQLELYEVLYDKDPDRAHRRVVSARQALATAMGHIRQLASDLRFSEAFEGLEQGLREFLAFIETDVIAPELTVTGDEQHFPPLVRYEIYLAIREAVRNALVHSKGRSISIVIDTRPDRLRAVVRDDGIGLRAAVSSSTGTGMASMEERVSLVGGSIHIEGTAGHGTTIEILVPAKL